MDWQPTETAQASSVFDGSSEAMEQVYQWCRPMVNPGDLSYQAVDLLMTKSFFDKSVALHQLLNDTFIQQRGDFTATPLLVVFPRRFAKTTLLGFIQAIYSDLPALDTYPSAAIKQTIMTLDKGRELLSFGVRPVLYLDMVSLSTVAGLKNLIKRSLTAAGLDLSDSWDSVYKDMSPAEMVSEGVRNLNESFFKKSGCQRKTILLIDEYDAIHRNKDSPQSLLDDLSKIYNLTKDRTSGVSLLILCGLTRIVGTGLSTLNNLVDVGQVTKYHGICGISARELVASVGTQFDQFAQEQYKKDFKGILHNEFRIRWNGFRFCFMGTGGILDPKSDEGALFSPIDAWELIQSLSGTGSTTPSSKWMETMQSELAFSTFHSNYTQSEAQAFVLFNLLGGGWIAKSDLKRPLRREDYLTLRSDSHVKKVFLELGFLTVRSITDTMVLLSPPNWTVTENAMMQLIGKTNQGLPSKEQAESYLSEDGLNEILAVVEKGVTNDYRETGDKVIREYPFQDHLYFQLLLRFPKVREQSDDRYELYKEVFSSRTPTSGKKHGFNDIAVELRYGKPEEKKVYLMELKVAKELKDAKATTNDIASIHKKNLKDANDQLDSYIWRATDCKSVQKIAISGVWHPDGDGNHCLNASSMFVL